MFLCRAIHKSDIFWFLTLSLNASSDDLEITSFDNLKSFIRGYLITGDNLKEKLSI